MTGVPVTSVLDGLPGANELGPPESMKWGCLGVRADTPIKADRNHYFNCL